MAKSSGGTRSSFKSYKNVTLVGGLGDAEITDSIYDYYLPSSVRAKLDTYAQITTYKKLEDYLKSQGIALETDRKRIVEEAYDKDIKAMEYAPQIVVAIETYKEIFGKSSISALKKVKMHDDTLDTTAAFHYNQKGERDPYAGTMRFASTGISGRIVFHEMAHVLQESSKRRGEDAVSSAARLVGDRFKGDGVRKAENFADKFSYGFMYGKKDDVDFINEIKKKRNSKS